MPLLDTATLQQHAVLPPSQGHQIYCGLDSALTREIHPRLAANAAATDGTNSLSDAEVIYNFERELQGPYLDIMTTGFPVDEQGRREVAGRLRDEILELGGILNELAVSVLDTPLNPRSRDQLKFLFYETMKLPRQIISQKGERKEAMNREVLEKLSDYLYARPFISVILQIRALSKQLEVFEEAIGSDGRFRTSYNIAGTETGRPSSSGSAFGDGGNAQNIAPSLRWAFTASTGHKLGQVDLEQVEARDVGWFCGCLFDDWTYLDACESGDLHTNTAGGGPAAAAGRGIWRSLPWTGDLATDRKIADRIFYREFSYRDMAKKGSHLSNYMGTAWTAAKALKVSQAMMEDFQARYCRGGRDRVTGAPIEPAYPAIPRWWQWTAQQLQTTHLLVTPFRRRRHFFGRPGDDTTLREAIAFLPQSTTADRMNLGLLRVWWARRDVQLFGNGYDSIIFEFPDRGPEYEGEVISDILELIRVVFHHPSGRRYEVPGEAKVGWNWGSRVTPAEVEEARRRGVRLPRLNPDGLIKWSPSRPDLRQRTRALDRTITVGALK